MNRKKLALTGALCAAAVAGVVSSDRALALEAAQLLSPSSYGELLQPIANAPSLLAAVDDLQAARQEPFVQLAQYGYYGWRHHHHHHHHRWWRRWRHHHHHHHHHHW